MTENRRGLSPPRSVILVLYAEYKPLVNCRQQPKPYLAPPHHDSHTLFTTSLHNGPICPQASPLVRGAAPSSAIRGLSDATPFLCCFAVRGLRTRPCTLQQQLTQKQATTTMTTTITRTTTICIQPPTLRRRRSGTTSISKKKMKNPKPSF